MPAQDLLTSRAQAELGICIGLMRQTANVIERDCPIMAKALRDQAKSAEAIRWERQQ